MTVTAIVTASDAAKFDAATVYDVTYVGGKEQDKDVHWGYVRNLVNSGQASRTVICRNRDGSDAGRREV